MIEKLHKHLEERVLSGLDLKKEHVLIEMTDRDYDRFIKIAEATNSELIPMHRGDPEIKIFNYHGVILRIRIGKKTSDFLK